MEDKLIIAVGSRPILYDQSMFTYRDIRLKNRAWQDVLLEVGETGNMYFLSDYFRCMYYFSNESVLNDC